jgi:hypothetical protein
MNLEDRLQQKCVIWFKNTYQMQGNGLIFSCPNGGTRNIIEAKKLKETGLMAGVADLIVLFPNGKLMFVELKTDTGKQSEKQIDFENRVKNLGFEYHLIRSIDEFKIIINGKA